MEKIRSWRVYGVQNPGDLDSEGNQKTRAFIALGKGHNPYQTYGILTTTSYKKNEINGEIIIKNLLNNQKINKLLPNNLVKIYNSNIIHPYFYRKNNKNDFLTISGENRNRIINHFNLQEYKKRSEFNFYSLDDDETIDYSYQAKTLLTGNEKNISKSKQATDDLVDKLQEMEFDSKNTILLSKDEHDNLTNQVLKYHEGWQYAESENQKLHQKLNELIIDKRKLLNENKQLKETIRTLQNHEAQEL